MSRDTTAADDTPDWTFGDPCPNCGETTVYYVERIGRRLSPGPDGGVRDNGLYFAAGCAVRCEECDTYLADEIDAETVGGPSV